MSLWQIGNRKIYHTELSHKVSSYYIIKQECIPVGRVPAARRPYAGVCFPGGGLPGLGGVCLVQGVSAWSGGAVSDPGGGLPGPWVVSDLGGVCLVGRGVLVSAWSGGCLPGPGRGGGGGV